MEKQRDESRLRDGYIDNLKPVKPLDLSKVATVGDLVEQMRDTSFGARSVGEAAHVLYEMTKQSALRRHDLMIDVAVERLIQSENELRHGAKAPASY